MVRVLACFLVAVTFAFTLAADRTPEPLPAEKAAKSAILPDGFRKTVFAAEPDVTQPISFTIDAKGRVWVIEATNYGEWKPTGKDRVVILEQREGKLHRTLFYEGFNYATGIEVGFGGVWVMSPPCLYFVPDRNNDDKPDGEPEVLFDGFGYKESRHNLANGFTWGPDGWLYGGHGRTSPSDVGRPGTPAANRVHCDGGVYRVHPTKLIFETFSDGTTNPWGVDFNEFGDCFVSNCVNPHLFHMIPGGHYEPWRNRSSSQYAYERLPTIADHLHYPGGRWQETRGETQETLAMGGGHAHCGTLIYKGGAFPHEYENAAFMCNVHGRRINHDILKPKGSGYTASHGKDFMISADPWFMGVTLRTGPDGSVFVSDWSDTGECHTYKPDRATGRIYKISYVGDNRGREPAWKPKDLTKLTDKELLDLHTEGNDYFCSHARRILQERAARPGWDGKAVRTWFRDLAFATEIETEGRLLGLWGLHVTGGIDAADSALLLTRDRTDVVVDREHLRARVVRLLCENGEPGEEFLKQFRELARHDGSPVVRLSLASVLQRLPHNKRWDIANELVRHSDDATDANLPLMYWYAIEPLVVKDPGKALTLALSAEVPLVRQFIARRLADEAAAKGDAFELAPLVAALRLSTPEVGADLLAGTREGLRGRKSLKMPGGWAAVYAKVMEGPNPAAKEHAIALALIFGDPQALADLRKIAANASFPGKDRVAALESLIDKRVADLAPFLHDQLSDKLTRRAALKGLAAYADPGTPKRILAVYVELTSEEKQDAISALTARKESAIQLLDALEVKAVPRGDISAFAARQIFLLGDAKVNDRLRTLWGEVRDTPAAKQEQIKKYKAMLTPQFVKNANVANGQALFAKSCQQCHKLYGEGGAIGPDITGSNRANLDYLLSNIVDPSSEVGRDFRMSVVRTTDDRVITGIVVERTAARIVLQTATDRLTLSPDDVESVKESLLSIMPEGQLDVLTREQVRDLIAFIASNSKAAPMTPLPQIPSK